MYRHRGAFYAYRNHCAHQGGSACEGVIKGKVVNNQTMLQETFKMINAETQLLYSSDYPHWDMDLPSTIYDLPFLNTQAKRNILGENARNLFKLDSYISDERKSV